MHTFPFLALHVLYLEHANSLERLSLVPAFQELWNVWEIHCLILISLSLQVFLFLFAGLRRCSTSLVLHTALWLAYLPADSVAIFVLGHLAVHASEPGHQLMSFWAPFVLVHLGGQSTITALSRQDNELWKRHLLSLVTQAAVAGYVVGTSSWPDRRLRAAMVVMFLSGWFKYAERTLCLYRASPERLRSRALDGLRDTLTEFQGHSSYTVLSGRNKARVNKMRKGLDAILEGSSVGLFVKASMSDDILVVDAAFNSAKSVSFAQGHLPGMLERFRSRSSRCMVYKHVGAVLSDFYRDLYTKNQESTLSSYYSFMRECVCGQQPRRTVICCCAVCCAFIGPFVLYELFHYVSTPIALVLFWAAEKGGQDHDHPSSSRADITVSYILLVGAIALDVSSAIISIFSYYNIKLPTAWGKKHWSEELAQYSMIKRHAEQDATGMASVCQWICRRLGLPEVTHTTIAEDRTPIKEFILDNLLGFGARRKWNIASTRGQFAFEEWMDQHGDGGPGSERIARKAQAIKTTGSGVDFPTSVLIWHIATDICYYLGDNDASNDSEKIKKHRQMSRELSNYIMYLVFKCGVMLTTNSRHVHEKANAEISKILSGEDQPDQQQVTTALDEKAVVMKLFEANKKDEQQEPADNNENNAVESIQQKLLKLIQDLDPPVREAVMKLFQAKKKEEKTNKSYLQELMQSAQALESPVLPRACEVAQELISISDETERWVLVASVWSEMLYYTAPRCGAAFHYEHLSTGGEFITHVLLLMRLLGPFLPHPGA